MGAIERLVVSRKTPGDGRLLLSAEAAIRLAATDGLRVEWAGRAEPARIVSLACACGRGGDGPHVHHFLESPLLTALAPDSEIGLHWDEGDGTVRVTLLREGPP